MELGIERRRALVALCGLIIGAHTGAAQPISANPSLIEYTAKADSLPLAEPHMVYVDVPPGADKVAFKFVGAVPSLAGGPNFMVVSPSGGVTPGPIAVALNPNVVPYLVPGPYGLILQFAAAGQSAPPYASIRVTLALKIPPPPSITSVVSAATFQPTISPGEVVSIYGANIGTPPVSAQYDGAGFYPTSLGNTTVTFNGVAAPLLYVSTSQINAVVPYAVSGQTTVDVIVTHNAQKSPPFSVPIMDTSPGIFTVGQNGSGQGAILNALTNSPLTLNSVDNPVPRGSYIVMWATGAGLWNQSVQDGSILLVVLEPPYFVPAGKVSLTIGGQPASISYAGGVPYMVSGMLQVNAKVPAGIGSGPQPVVLTIGQNNNAQQNVTVAVQ